MPQRIDVDRTVRHPLVDRVLNELLDMRGTKGRLTPQKLARYPALLNITGGDDLLDAFMSFRRELRRYVETANRNEAAAALSISAPDEQIGHRLEYCANRLSADPRNPSEPRTARGWSDEGMPAIAEDLVYLAEVRGRLGAEMLSIAVHGENNGSISVAVEQVLQGDVQALPPTLSVWLMDADGDPEELHVGLGDLPMTVATSQTHRMNRQQFLLCSDLLERTTERHGLSLAVTGRDAPMRTASFSAPTGRVPETLAIAYSAYRTRVVVEFTRTAGSDKIRGITA